MVDKISKTKLLLIIILTFIYWSYAIQKDSISFSDGSIQKNISKQKSLRVLSWNIKMLPAPYGWLFEPFKRADNIIKVLKESNKYDIICFQEAFSASIRRKIYAELQHMYPYELEPDDQIEFYKINSGLWVISQLPLTLKNQISFTQFKHSDRLVSKGAQLFSIKKNKQEFHFIHTHMQADYKTKYSDVRTLQYTEIYNKIIRPYGQKIIPMILIGDLNIAQPEKLEHMLQKLNLINGPIMGRIQHTSFGKSKELIDYILVSRNYSKFKSIKRRIIDFSYNLKDKEFNLSDHYPIEAVFSW